jgi:pSer/pThr/pTyr-binding forkhead associated (FHA) protein
VDGKPEIEIGQPEFVMGSGEDVDLRLDLPLISPRHARILWREGRHVFEDLRSDKGSFRLGQPVDVRFIETGDEIDLGGFLPVRFRLA